MQITQKLVEKFFAGQCTAEEARMVSKFLEDQSNRELYLNTGEWEKFQPEEEITAKVSDGMYVKILDRIYDAAESKRSYFRYWSYAASILIVASIGLFGYLNQRKATPANSFVSTKKVDKLQTKYAKFLTNTSNHKQNYTLPDGSIVELDPKSEISFLPFDQGKRDINLTGRALFRVHKDKAKPFTVFANNLATTALGTVFKITAFKKGTFTTVKLIEGKVVVKPNDKMLNAGVKTVYLTPGKQLTVNMQTYLAKVTNFDVAPAMKTESLDHNKAVMTESAIIFDNENLAGVFNLLENKLNIKIKYSANQLSKKVFTGQYEFGRDDADTFLNMLCSLNNLIAEKTEEGYTIKKK